MPCWLPSHVPLLLCWQRAIRRFGCICGDNGYHNRDPMPTSFSQKEIMSMFGFEWPLPWYAQTAFWSAAAGTGNVPTVLLSLTGMPWTTGVPGQSNRSLTGPYWSSMLLPHSLAKLWAMPTPHGSNTITAVVVAHGSHSEPASWFRRRCMHYISDRLEIWVESAA